MYIVFLTVIFPLNFMRRMLKIIFPSLQIQKCSGELGGWGRGGGEVYVVVFFILDNFYFSWFQLHKHILPQLKTKEELPEIKNQL